MPKNSCKKSRGYFLPHLVVRTQLVICHLSHLFLFERKHGLYDANKRHLPCKVRSGLCNVRTKQKFIRVLRVLVTLIDRQTDRETERQREILACRSTYMVVLRAAEVNNNTTIVVETHLPEVSDRVFKWQLCRYVRCFTRETLHNIHINNGFYMTLYVIV